jgi:hypothetical protein
MDPTPYIILYFEFLIVLYSLVMLLLLLELIICRPT